MSDESEEETPAPTAPGTIAPGTVAPAPGAVAPPTPQVQMTPPVPPTGAPGTPQTIAPAQPDAAPPQPSAPTTDKERIQAALPNYEVGEEIGRGGWGVVYAGVHRQLGRPVAIKELPSGFGNDAEVRARFVAEAQMLAALDHPHVVPIYDYVETDGMCLLVMENLSGGTVWNRFASVGMSMEAACAAVLATCAGLESAHRHQILHRDIKPENLIFNNDGTLKVTDFGIAKVLSGTRTMATRAGEVIGTPAYMAPEQARGGELTPATDVYAVGVMLYELLSGRRPYEDDGDPLSLLFKHAYEDAMPLNEIAPNVPMPLVEVTMKALSKEQGDRYPTAEAFGVAVAEAATEAWGPGWLMRASLPVMAAGGMVAATERVAVGAAPPSAVQDQQVHPSAAEPARMAPRPKEFSAEDLVPLEDIVPRPATAAPLWLLMLALVGAAVAFAFTTNLGHVERAGDIPPGTITVAGADPSAGTLMTLDFAKPFTLTGRIPPNAAGANQLKLSFSTAGVPLGTGGTKLALNPDGTFTSSVDATVTRYLMSGKSTGKVRYIGPDGATLATREFEAASTQKWYLTAPFWLAVLVLVMSLSYSESILRTLRRGRKRVPGVIGLTVLGVPVGLAISAMAWGVLNREPTKATVAATVAFACAGGLVGAWGGIQSGRRRRSKREEQFRARQAESRPSTP
ncbi:MAG: hypothetical protein QOE35_652 [Actinomycetota bacterium]|jgi:serine/threonine-protein kinase